MRHLIVILGVFASWTASAADTQPTPGNSAKTPHIIPGNTVAAMPFAEWEEKDARGSSMHLARGKREVAKAPATAVRYEVKSVSYPTGTVSVFTFTKNNGGVLHALRGETEIYVLKGTAEVGVAGKPTPLKTGDAVSIPSGVLRSGGAPEDAVIVAWTVGSTAKDPKPMLIRGEDVPAEMTGEWDANGSVVRTATTAETNQQAPANARRLLSKRYEFDGNSIRVAHLYKGASRAPALTQIDSLIYVTEGHLRFHEGNEVREVRAGDFIHEEAGLIHIWDQIDDGGFVTTTGYPVASKEKK